VTTDPKLRPAVEALAQRIVEEGGSPQLAWIIAEATVEVSRIRHHRHDLIHNAPKLPDLLGRKETAEEQKLRKELEILPELRRLDRYERRALSRRNRAIRNMDALRRVTSVQPSPDAVSALGSRLEELVEL
jgi:hypothetical protein